MKQLEQILETVKTSKYKTIDIYAVGTLAIYSSPMMNFNFPLAYNDSASSPYERQTNLSEYGMPKLPEFKLPEIQPIIIEPIGLITKEPFQYGYGLDNNLKIDFHGPDINTISHGHVKLQGSDLIIKEYNGYECSMLDPILKNNFNKFP